MDERTTKIYTSFGKKKLINPVTFRTKSRVRIFFDRTFSKENILKSLFGVFLLVLIIPLSLNLLVILTFGSRLSSSEDELPTDYNTAVVYISQSNNDYKWEKIFSELRNLYKDRKIEKIYFFYSYYNAQVTSLISRDFDEKDIIINNETLTPLEVCGEVKNKYKLDRIVIFSKSDKLIRLSYACSSNDVLQIPFRTDDNVNILNSAEFFQLAKDLFKINLEF